MNEIAKLETCKTENCMTKSVNSIKQLNNCPFVHILTAASVCQPKVAFMKTKLTTALTLQWKCQQALVGFTILKLPSQFICSLWLVVPLIMQVNLIGNIRGIAKPVIYREVLLSRHIQGHCAHCHKVGLYSGGLETKKRTCAFKMFSPLNTWTPLATMPGSSS